jgi:hypothetical protein
MNDRERKQAAVEALRAVHLTTDLPAAIRPYQANRGSTYTGLRSGAAAADHRTPRQRAVTALRAGQ